MDHQVKYLLDESEMPRQWYNVIADLPSPPPPPLHPGTGQPVGPDDLAPLFPMALIAQEVSPDRFIDIPEPVPDVYRLWRPTPLFRARRLEKELGTPARIYYKYEGLSPGGLAQAQHRRAAGLLQRRGGRDQADHRDRRGPVGQRAGVRLAPCSASSCEVWQVRASYDQKPYRRLLMETYGATVHPSPSEVTSSGRAVLAEHPDSPGSLGIAISEAVEVAGGDPAARYALGSVLNHVLLHQTVIGEEAIKQLAMAGDTPDVIVGCTGGGSNFSGPGVPVPAGEARRADQPGVPGRRARRLPVVHPGRVRLRLRRHRRVHPAAQDAHARARLHARTRSTPAGCGTTGCRRCCRTSTSWA